MGLRTSSGERVCGASPFVILFGLVAFIGSLPNSCGRSIEARENSSFSYALMGHRDVTLVPKPISFGANSTQPSVAEGSLVLTAVNCGFWRAIDFLRVLGLDLSSRNQEEESAQRKAVEESEGQDTLKGVELMTERVVPSHINLSTVSPTLTLHSFLMTTSPSSVSFPSSTIYPANFNVHKKKWMYNTELHLAAERGDEAAVRELVRKGADVNARNSLKETPLHKAAYGCWKNRQSSGTSCLNVVDFLVERGANVNANDRRGKTFLHIMFDGMAERPLNSSQLHQVVEKYGHLFNVRDLDPGNQFTALDSALATVKKIEPSTITLLHEKGVNFTGLRTYGLTVLVDAIIGFQSGAVLAKLIEFGANYTWLDNGGGSLLHWAVTRGNAEALAFLIQKGGLDIDGRDNLGRTPLYMIGYTRRTSGANPLEVVRLLLDNGADKSAQDEDGRTPYLVVKDMQSIPDKGEILKLLSLKG